MREWINDLEKGTWNQEYRQSRWKGISSYYSWCLLADTVYRKLQSVVRLPCAATGLCRDRLEQIAGRLFTPFVVLALPLQTETRENERENTR